MPIFDNLSRVLMIESLLGLSIGAERALRWS
jgi:hypothetical protein